MPPAWAHARRSEQQVVLGADRPSRNARPSTSGTGAGNPAARERRTIPTSVPGSSSHGTPQRPCVDPMRLTTARATTPRGWIGLPWRSRVMTSKTTASAAPATRGAPWLPLSTGTGSTASVTGRPPLPPAGPQVFACSSSGHLSVLSQPYLRQVPGRWLAPVPLLNHPGVDGDATSNPSARDVNGC